LKGANADAYGIYGVAGVLSINTRKDAKIDIDVGNGNLKFNAKTATPLKTITETNNRTYRSSNLAGSGHADQVIKGDDIRNSPSLSDALNGRLRGIDMVNGQAYVKGSVGSGGGGMVPNPMLLVVDGSIVRASLDNYNTNDIETVEVLTGANASIYGVDGGPGVLVITTRQAGGGTPVTGSQSSSALGTLQFTPKGFYKAREFYSPKYMHADNAKTPDLRSTIFWKPEVVTDKDGNASFDFYNADGKGVYRLVIEGIDNAGNIGRQVYTYKVE
jgi:TonB-dependent SusC/RagA subfamily outer membrane receptor